MTGAPARLFRNARLATFDPASEGIGIVERGAIAAKDGRIVYAGAEAELPSRFSDTPPEIVDCEGRWITPGLVDCHTHLVFAGDRAREFELRLQGASYEEIARAGGGILSTVRAVRAADEAGLLAQSLPRARARGADCASSASSPASRVAWTVDTIPPPARAISS